MEYPCKPPTGYNTEMPVNTLINVPVEKFYDYNRVNYIINQVVILSRGFFAESIR